MSTVDNPVQVLESYLLDDLEKYPSEQYPASSIQMAAEADTQAGITAMMIGATAQEGAVESEGLEGSLVGE